MAWILIQALHQHTKDILSLFNNSKVQVFCCQYHLKNELWKHYTFSVIHVYFTTTKDASFPYASLTLVKKEESIYQYGETLDHLV